MELQEIIKLIDAVSESSLTGFSLDDGKIRLSLETYRGENKKTTDNTLIELQDSASSREQIQIHPENVAKEEEGYVMKSPLVGVYYSAPSPDQNDYVKIGDVVKKGQVLGIIEAMKLMNEIECEADGKLTEILVKNGQMVEYGQPMFVIKPEK